MQFSIKTLLIIQVVVAILSYIAGQINLLVFCLILFPFTWLVPIIWTTVRVGSRNRRENLLFYRSQEATPQPQRKIPVDTTRFLELVELSGLLTADQVEDFPNYFSDEEWESLSVDPKHVAEQMVEQELLTRWQSDLLLAGKYKGFFISKYKLLKILGSGRTTSVYLAEPRSLGEQVAIKILAKTLAEQPEEVARFIRSVRLPGMLDHPRFIHSQDFERMFKIYFVVQAYESGKDLMRVIEEQGPLDCMTAIKYLAQVSDGVARMHHFDLVHRDLKPEHLYLTEEHGLKIMGLSLTVSVERATKETVDHQTRYFESPDFLAPELVYDPQSVGPPTDVYSLGCIFYYLLSGNAPFASASPKEKEKSVSTRKRTRRSRRPSKASFESTMRLHQTAPIPPIEPYLEKAPNLARLTTIYERMMAKSPADRYRDAGILFKELEDYLTDIGESVD